MTRNLQISLFAAMLAAAGLPLYIHLPRYAAAELGLSLQAAGALLIAVRVLDFAQDPLLGRMIDRFPAARGGFATAAALGMGRGLRCCSPCAPVRACWSGSRLRWCLSSPLTASAPSCFTAKAPLLPPPERS